MLSQNQVQVLHLEMFIDLLEQDLNTLSRGMVMRGVPDDVDKVRPAMATSPCGIK